MAKTKEMNQLDQGITIMANEFIRSDDDAIKALAELKGK